MLQAASDRVLQAIPQTREWNTVRQEIENRGITDRIKEQMTRLDAPNREQIDRVLNQAQQLQKEAWNRINQAITQLERSVKNEQDPVRFKQDVVQQIVRTIGMAANQKQAADQVQTFLIRENIEPIPSSRLQQLVENVRHHLNQGREEAAVRQITAALQTEGSTEGETRPLVQVFNRESAQQVQEIMRQIQGSGSTEQTVERIQALLSKQSPTQVQQLVENVRQLLNQGREETAVRQITAFVEGDANRSSEVRPVQQIERQPGQLVQEVLRQIQTSVNSQQSVERIEALFKNENRAISLTQVQQLVESVRQYVSQGRVEAANQLIDASLSQITASSNTNVAQVNSGGDGQSTSASPSLFVEQAMRLLQSEPHIGRVIEQMQARIEQLPVQDSVKVEVVQQLVDAKQTAQSGREMKARQEVAQVIQQIEQQVQPTIPNKETAAYIVNEQFQTSEQASSKMIAVTTVSEKMAQLAADFKQFQREMHRTLDQTARLIEQVRKQANVQAKPLLEKTISRLDQTILKSEMMLFTDMKTERELMQASNRLAEAKQLLAKGSYREASQIVREVNQLVEKVHFQPSETKVKHYTAAREEALRNMQLPEQALTKQLSETLRPIPEPSPRAMLELMRSLGLNRDQELAQQLVTGNREQVAEQQNLKSLLLQLARGEEEGSRTQQLANQALNNLTGQQLLSRSDQQSMQSLFFQLPFLLEEKVENLKVFVNSRNEGEKVDWENCSIYFLMQTPKMGEIGILVSVKDRQLSVTLKNDQTDFQSKMEPLVQQSIENLGDLGFQIKGIHYSPLQSQDQEEGQKGNDDIQQRATFTEKGFDYRI
ncbi:hypothetical protein [Bacillus sp. JCM 19034]|uniref:hypothetical protein n=1 Tax=Bacillus sp. JCM 19034 TaxID=1481928 RepID=UPI000781C38C|nr:hypothetical protein [Bacillus sp. JCM 19034]